MILWENSLKNLLRWMKNCVRNHFDIIPPSSFCYTHLFATSIKLPLLSQWETIPKVVKEHSFRIWNRYLNREFQDADQSAECSLRNNLDFILQSDYLVLIVSFRMLKLWNDNWQFMSTKINFDKWSQKDEMCFGFLVWFLFVFIWSLLCIHIYKCIEIKMHCRGHG